MALFPPVLFRRLLAVVGVLVACGDDDPPKPAPVVASAGSAGSGGESAAGSAGAGGDAGGGAGGTAGQGGGGAPSPGCFNPGPGVCCSAVKCYTPDELTKLGCSAVDLQTEGCPYPVELPMGNCYWYEESSKAEDGKCCYTYFSGSCCGPS